MKVCFKALAVALVVLVSTTAVHAGVEDDVLVLRTATFDEAIKNAPVALVEFYAPWCGHCKKLVEPFGEAATTLKADGIPLAKVDATEERDLASKYDVKGYPTLIVFREGVEAGTYQGERSAAAMVAYMRRQKLPSVSVFTTAEEAMTFSGSNKVVIMAFVTSTENNDAYKTFHEVAVRLRDDFTFGAYVTATFDHVTGALGETVSANDIIMFKNLDKEHLRYVASSETGDEAAFALGSWIASHSVALIDEIGPTNYKAYVDAGVPLAMLFVDPKEADHMALVGQVREVAAAHRGSLSFVWVDSSKYIGQAKKLGLSGDKVPCFAVDDLVNHLHYAFSEEAAITPAALSEWIGRVKSGAQPPTVMSDPIPLTNDEPVKVVVANQFTELVLDDSKDVFIEIYAPWCGHCKKLAPIWDDLAVTFSPVSSVVIAKMDGTTNDPPGYLEVRGFPTLVFFPAGSKDKPKTYNGDRTHDAMRDFVVANAGIKFNLAEATAAAAAAAAAAPKDEL